MVKNYCLERIPDLGKMPNIVSKLSFSRTIIVTWDRINGHAATDPCSNPITNPINKIKPPVIRVPGASGRQ